MNSNRKMEKIAYDLNEFTVKIWRCAAVIKGGRRFSFGALVVVGDGRGNVGYGYGKAKEVPSAIEKAGKEARKNLIRVPLVGNTIPHEVLGRFGAARVVLVPAYPGTGVIAGEAVRAVVQALGIRDVLTKSIGGTNNKKNLVKATFDALHRLRHVEDIEKLRGVKLDYHGKAGKEALQVAEKPDAVSVGGNTE